MTLRNLLYLVIILFINFEVMAQQTAPSPSAVNVAPDVKKEDTPDKNDELPNGKRIRRHVSLIVGIEHDEEFLIPDIPLTVGGRSDFFDINRIKGTDFFRMTPKKPGSGIMTLKNTKTKQIIVEIRFDIRDDSVEKTLREVQALLGDIEGIEFKIVNQKILIDGFVLIPHDLIRIGQVITDYKPQVLSLATLSPIARKKIAEFITNDINNPEVKVTAVGDFLKLEGQVSKPSEKERIKQIVSLYIPDMVYDQSPNDGLIKIVGRKPPTRAEDIIIDLITIRPDEEKVEPPPKMIQVVAHFVKFADSYEKTFSFIFNPAVSTSAAGGPSNSTIDSTIALLNNLLPKLNWSKKHGYAKVLDTASILVQDKVEGEIKREILTPGPPGPPPFAGAPPTATTISARVSLLVTPIIKSERSGLIELSKLTVFVSTSGGGSVEQRTETNVRTTISVRDRQSAAFGGVIKKGTETSFGAPATSSTDPKQPLITLQAAKNYNRNNSQFVVFVTPIIKSSASSGVEQVKKKFRLRD